MMGDITTELVERMRGDSFDFNDEKGFIIFKSVNQAYISGVTSIILIF